MGKKINNLICFLVVMLIVVTGIFPDLGMSYKITSVTEEESGENLTVEDMQNSTYYKAFGIRGFDNERFRSRSLQLSDESAYAANEDGTELAAFGFVAGKYATALTINELTQAVLPIGITRIYTVDNTSAEFACDGVTFSSSNSQVVAVEDSDLTDIECNLVRKGPGTAAITATFTEGGKYTVFQFYVHVEFSLIRTSSEWKMTGLEGFSEKILVLDQRDYLTDPYHKLTIQLGIKRQHVQLHIRAIHILHSVYHVLDKLGVRCSRGVNTHHYLRLLGFLFVGALGFHLLSIAINGVLTCFIGCHDGSCQELVQAGSKTLTTGRIADNQCRCIQASQF